MSWFERHLNWTAVFITIASLMLGFLLADILYSLLTIMYRHYFIGTNYQNVITLSTFDFGVFLSAFGLARVVKKKKRSIFWLLPMVFPIFSAV